MGSTGAGVPSPAQGVWRRVASSPSWVQGGAPAKNEFWSIYSLKKHTDSHKSVIFDISAAYI